MTPLDRCPIGEPCRITEIEDPEARTHLLRFGLVEGSVITPSHRLPGGGPIVLRSRHQQIALGRAMARTIKTATDL